MFWAHTAVAAAEYLESYVIQQSLIYVLYAAVVSFLAYKKTTWLIKMVKMKFGKNINDKSAIITCFAASGVFSSPE
jgi:hypothetical protein